MDCIVLLVLNFPNKPLFWILPTSTAQQHLFRNLPQRADEYAKFIWALQDILPGEPPVLCWTFARREQTPSPDIFQNLPDMSGESGEFHVLNTASRLGTLQSTLGCVKKKFFFSCKTLDHLVYHSFWTQYNPKKICVVFIELTRNGNPDDL